MAKKAVQTPLQVLKNIERLLYSLYDIQFSLYNQKELPAIFHDNGWTVKTIGKSVTYEQTITYTGTTLTVNRDFPVGIAVKRIDQIWSNATAKDINVRLYSDVSSPYYSQLKTATGDTNTSVVLSPTTDGELMFPAAGRIQFYYTNFTAGNVIKIVIVGELP